MAAPPPRTPSEPGDASGARSLSLWTLAVLLLAVLVASVLTVTRNETSETLPGARFLPGNPGRGGELFYERGCARCHAVAGAGGHEAPDIARSHRAPADLEEVAASMWNHAPKMWERMRTLEYPVLTLTPRDFMDLMAFLFAAGNLEETGDPARGAELLKKKGCLSCHGAEAGTSGAAPAFSLAPSSINPIVWAQLLWNHAPLMETALQAEGLPWPQLTPSEAADLLAFLRSVGSETRTLAPLAGDPWVGRYLFRTYCQRCHTVDGEGGRVGPDLSTASAPPTLAGIAASLWNHVPAMDERMRQLGIERPSFSEQEMADLITYLFALRYVEKPGDPAAGAAAFARICSSCHGERGEGGDAPSLRSLGGRTNVSFMASTLWNHGPRMYNRMSSRGVEWPVLEENEIRDLIAYLRGLSSSR